MLLTITYTGTQTQDLGYLLHKNPHRAQCFALCFGNAYVFYPELSDARTTAALLLDLDPIDLARGKIGAKDSGLFDYVNDRPYAATSFLSTALVRIFGTAIHGRCDKRPDLVKMPLDLSARIHCLPCGGNRELPKKIFEPLGYSVKSETVPLDERFPEWGESPYLDLTIRGTVTLSALLNHLYVLIPMFDRQKHYYVTEEEIDKLLKHGEGWLATHPERDTIVKRYFFRQKVFAYRAIDRLMEAAPRDPADTSEEPGISEPDAIVSAKHKEKDTSLHTMRLEAVKNAVLKSGAVSVLDLGCGEGRLTAMLLREPQIKKIKAVDVSISALEKAKKLLHYDALPAHLKGKLTLMQGALTYKDARFSGYDAACLVEVIEHLDPLRLPAFERVIFEFAAPDTVIVTTPNREYNARYPRLPEGGLRHSDHRFEWTRREFASWTEHICAAFGYTVERTEIGDADEKIGAPTQMGVFQKCV